MIEWLNQVEHVADIVRQRRQDWTLRVRFRSNAKQEPDIAVFEAVMNVLHDDTEPLTCGFAMSRLPMEQGDLDDWALASYITSYMEKKMEEYFNGHD